MLDSSLLIAVMVCGLDGPFERFNQRLVFVFVLVLFFDVCESAIFSMLRCPNLEPHSSSSHYCTYFNSWHSYCMSHGRQFSIAILLSLEYRFSVSGTRKNKTALRYE